jgi:hypothetical protein
MRKVSLFTMQRSVATLRSRPILAILFALTLIGSILFPVAQSEAAPILAAIPVPGGLTVRQDDRVATLQWDFEPKQPVRPLPAGVSGYRVLWGPVANPAANVKLTEHRIIQLQPLVNGQQYVAKVQSVDFYGNYSAPSASIAFTGNSSRVDALRAQMTGFFDDFNLPEGPADDLKWNTAYSRCNAEDANMYFINGQSHVHNVVYSGRCDRSQQVNRVRTPLDLSDNGTRTIVFDFDGLHHDRNHWYLDLVPQRMDIATTFESVAPGALRFTQHDQTLIVSLYDSNGTEKIIKQIDTLGLLGVESVPNVRRSWVIKVRKDHVDVTIDGKLVLSTDPGTIQLTSNSYHVLWSVFSYNTQKANKARALAHWDNFGFDAPAGKQPTVVTHNYKVVNSGSDFINALRWNGSSPATVMLSIPDQVSGALARRLMFTLQMNGNDVYKWSASDKVMVNGRAFALPAVSRTIDSIRPYSMIIDLPDGVLRQGLNTIVFDTEMSAFLNIHAELDFNKATAPTYTQPIKIALGQAILPTSAVGPNLNVASLNGSPLGSPDNPTLSGVVPVTVVAHNSTAEEATGSNTGVVMLALMVDKKVVQVQRTDFQSPSPSTQHTFNLDTRQLANGAHELFIQAFNAQCTPSIVDYGTPSGVSGKYVPIAFTAQNSGAQANPTNVSLAATGSYKIYMPLIAKNSGSALGSVPCLTSVQSLSDASSSAPGGAAQASFSPLTADLPRQEDATDGASLFICEW